MVYKVEALSTTDGFRSVEKTFTNALDAGRFALEHKRADYTVIIEAIEIVSLSSLIGDHGLADDAEGGDDVA